MDPQRKPPARGEGAVYRDRSVGLVVFGVLEIVIGGLCALLVPLGLVARWLTGGASGGAGSLRSTVPVLLIYAVFAVLLIWLGIGSIRARRWACDLMLSISRIWLLTGVCAVLVIWAILPGMVRGFGTTGSLAPEAVYLATAATLAIVGLIYVVLPGAFLLFYRSPDVAATCSARDPGSQLTAGWPPRVVTLVVVWGLAAVSVLVMPAYNWVFPFFGVLLKGTAGVVPWITVFVFSAGLAVGSSRRRPWAWWGGIAATVAATVATVLTSIRVPPGDVLLALRLPDDQLKMLASISWPDTWVVMLVWIAVWGSMLAYLMTVRRYFVHDPTAPYA